MKDIAHARALQTQLSSVAEEGNTKVFAVKQSKELNTQNLKGGEVGYGDAGARVAGEFQFVATMSEIGHKR